MQPRTVKSASSILTGVIGYRGGGYAGGQLAVPNTVTAVKQRFPDELVLAELTAAHRHSFAVRHLDLIHLRKSNKNQHCIACYTVMPPGGVSNCNFCFEAEPAIKAR